MWQDEYFDDIRAGDTVYYQNAQGQTHKGRAVMRGPDGWVISVKGRHPWSTCQVVNEGYNYLGHSKGKVRTPDHLGAFLNQ